MQRYLIELSYKGTRYSGFQVQNNANSIQQEVQNALYTFYRQQFELTGSSRTDAGVHAKQNFFHFDTDLHISPSSVYNLNAILPHDIVIQSIKRVAPDFHCRFSATSRLYEYHLYKQKDPFLTDYAWHYPYTINLQVLHEAAAIIKGYTDFSSFSKRNTQVKTFRCAIFKSEWKQVNNGLVYTVEANRFLRGMVRALVATMLKTARGTITIDELKKIVESKDMAKADFSAPAHGLYLMKVNFGEDGEL